VTQVMGRRQLPLRLRRNERGTPRCAARQAWEIAAHLKDTTDAGTLQERKRVPATPAGTRSLLGAQWDTPDFKKLLRTVSKDFYVPTSNSASP